MNTTKKLSLFIFAFMLVGAGCFGGKTEQKTITEPKVEVTQDSNTGVIKDMIEEPKTSDETKTTFKSLVAENETFKMVDDPKPATTFDKTDHLRGFVSEEHVLKMDLDGDGQLEYAIIHNQKNGDDDTDIVKTTQHLTVYKWDGEDWIIIFSDSILRKGGTDTGWFNRYEVTKIDGGNHVFYLEKANGDGQIEEYYFGELKDGSFGKIK